MDLIPLFPLLLRPDPGPQMTPVTDGSLNVSETTWNDPAMVWDVVFHPSGLKVRLVESQIQLHSRLQATRRFHESHFLAPRHLDPACSHFAALPCFPTLPDHLTIVPGSKDGVHLDSNKSVLNGKQYLRPIEQQRPSASRQRHI